MSRIRTIKPDLFRHEHLFEIERHVNLPLRVAFMGLLTCCDRRGRFRWRPRQLKLDIMPYDEIDFRNVLEALHGSGFIHHYEHEGEYYGYIPSWEKHQAINNREPESTLPDPTHCKHISAPVLHGQTSNDGALSSQSIACPTQSKFADDPTTYFALHRHAEEEREKEKKGNGREPEWEEEGCGKEKPKKTEIAQARSHSICKTDVLNVFEFWKRTLNHPNAVLDEKRKATISKALQAGYNVTQLCDAITGCSHTPHNMGDNDRGQRFDGLQVILRDADQIDRFIANSHKPPRPLSAAEKLMHSNHNAVQAWLEQNNVGEKHNG